MQDNANGKKKGGRKKQEINLVLEHGENFFQRFSTTPCSNATTERESGKKTVTVLRCFLFHDKKKIEIISFPVFCFQARFYLFELK